MSYIQQKEKMKSEAEARRNLVWNAIKITFITLAVLLVLFCVTLILTLIFDKDKEAPIISGPDGGIIVGYVGDNPRYKQWIELSDNEDTPEELKENLQINYNSVKKDVEGEYKVFYRVTDKAGNVSATYTLIYVVKSKAHYDQIRVVS